MISSGKSRPDHAQRQIMLPLAPEPAFDRDGCMGARTMGPGVSVLQSSIVTPQGAPAAQAFTMSVTVIMDLILIAHRKPRCCRVHFQQAGAISIALLAIPWILRPVYVVIDAPTLALD
jgi:hypothetical protein